MFIETMFKTGLSRETFAKIIKTKSVFSNFHQSLEKQSQKKSKMENFGTANASFLSKLR